MKKFEVFVTKVPLRDNRTATEMLNLQTAKGFGVIFATASGSDLVVLMQRESETMAKVAEKKKEARKKAEPKKKAVVEVPEAVPSEDVEESSEE